MSNILFQIKISITFFSKEAFRNLIIKFTVTDSESDVKNQDNENNAYTLLAVGSITDNPKFSCTDIRCKQKFVTTIFFCKSILHPAKPKFLRTLQVEDEDRRLEICL